MNILLIGSGGREHALAWAISASPASRMSTSVPGGRLLRSWSRATMLSTSLEAMTRWRWLAS